MNVQQAKYELLKGEYNTRQKHTVIQVCILIGLCTMCSIAVYATWTAIYKKQLNIPPKLNEIPNWWQNRAILYANSYQIDFSQLNDSNTKNNSNNNNSSSSNNKNNINLDVKQLENEKIYPSKYGNFIYSASNSTKLVCYYDTPYNFKDTTNLLPNNIDPYLCTHINVGIITVINNEMIIDDRLIETFKQILQLKRKNSELKILLWVGGGDNSIGFSEMIKNHANRKIFIKSLKLTLETYRLDGIDLDWEFPSAYNRERQHFSQLLHEIRREYEREHRTYLLSVAVAAPQSIAYFAYDINEINSYADYVNIMTYDYHFYTKQTPFTGLNAPLYKRHNEGSILATLNINATANYWHKNGLDKNKIVIGLPTYGHSFRLVNAFNTKIGAPANDFGFVGSIGFVTYSDICWFKENNIYITNVFDIETCSPYLYSGTEWLSYEDEQSIECKTNYIQSNGFGGVMIFSLNTDDYSSYCNTIDKSTSDGFPLLRKIYSILFDGMKKFV